MPRPRPPRQLRHTLTVDDLGFGNPIRVALEERIDRQLRAANGRIDDWHLLMAQVAGVLTVSMGSGPIHGETVLTIGLPQIDHPAYLRLLHLAQLRLSGEDW